ncbi:hypothetical protein [Halomicrobium urmianum]|uniref:hypothetical protein n=1 Tax=Halomicrobium urmianum TaxID=1586233 RepID=UPI001CD9311E|nr:hypothetical protein [Halomicrobium urmianum]
MPADPRCPECDGKVSSRAGYCMHCGAEFDEPSVGDDGPAPGGEDDSLGARVSVPDVGASVEAAVGGGAGDRPSTGASGGPSPGDASGAAASDDAPLLDPDGLADDALTLVAGVGFGVVVGVGAALLGLVLTRSVWSLLVALALWLAGTGYLITRRSVHETARLGCYAVAVLVVCVPTIVLTDAAKGGTFAGQVLLFAIAEVPFGAVAALIAGTGYWIGKRAPTGEEAE